ncbi:MAG TPA: hypothetical protein VEA99_07405, partial [Gemmatimonadaceae bacterium]|nr:hypothetical protein [Gemmatimonadaceae bacterium]
MLDLDRGRLVMRQTRGYPGGFYYDIRYVTDGARSLYVDERNGTYRPERYPAADQQLGNLFMLPQFYLLAAAEHAAPGTRRWLGRVRLPDGAQVEAVSFPLAFPNSQLTLGFDPRRHRLAAVMSPATDPLLGDTEAVTVFEGYRDRGGLLLPATSTAYRGGQVVSRLTFREAVPGYAVPDSLLGAPAGFARMAEATDTSSVREVARGVHPPAARRERVRARRRAAAPLRRGAHLGA